MGRQNPESLAISPNKDRLRNEVEVHLPQHNRKKVMMNHSRIIIIAKLG